MALPAFLVFAATLLAGIVLAWLLKSGRWRERRFWPVAFLLVGGYALLARRLGWGELLVVFAVVLVPLMFTPRRAP